MQKLELLAPAKNFEFGQSAIQAGADAVFIGGPSFNARINASNTVEEIARMVDFAHIFNAKVYVPLNTIIYDSELKQAQKLINDLYEIGVDALIVQDMGVLEMDLPPIPLFASTQCHNHSWEKVKFLQEVGFQRVILARELSLLQIQEIRAKTKVPLEFFVHGALCVSYSGQCYFSQAVCKRSANRGECAQMCRLKYSLEDAEGIEILQDKYLLSLKDFKLEADLESLITAGISSFKIEGRLKDLNYVKNITSLYRQKLDQIIAKNSVYKKTSSGKIFTNFKPNAVKTFNRGFTDYFLKQRNLGILSPDTQKALGEFLGEVDVVTKTFFTLKTTAQLNNADGICFFDHNRVLQGVHINRVEQTKIFPRDMQNIFSGAKVYRNLDTQFNKEMKQALFDRKIGVTLNLSEDKQGALVSVEDDDLNKVNFILKVDKILANDVKKAEENLEKQLSKMGETIFYLKKLQTQFKQVYFFPISVLNELRRQVCDLILLKRKESYQRKEVKIDLNTYPYPQKTVDYHANVANDLAKQFYEKHGATVLEKAFELQNNPKEKDVMTTKHCLKFQIGLCPKQKTSSLQLKEPFYLLGQSRKYRLNFDCQNCEMKIILI